MAGPKKQKSDHNGCQDALASLKAEMVAGCKKFDVADEGMFFSAFQYAAIGMALVAPDGSWLRVNRALCGIVGYSESELYSKTFQDITHPDDLDEDLEFVRQMLDGSRQSYHLEKRYIHKEGHVVNVLLSVSLVHNADGTPAFFISQIQDITKRVQLESELMRFAMEDALTGVRNRRYFLEIASQEMLRGNRYREPQAVFMLDIDHFKRINDTYGHDIGDQVLKEVAKICSGSLREVDIFGRLGGEEFGALLVNIDAEMSFLIADRLRKSIECCMVQTDKGPVAVTVSIGLTAFMGGGASLDARLKAADTALYEAKAAGRNRVVARNEELCFGTAEQALETVFLRLHWKPEYESGNTVIDAQHRELFETANTLLSFVLGGRAKAEISGAANELKAQVIKHFRDESEIFRAASYPFADEHSRIHNKLVQQMSALLERFGKGLLSVGELFAFIAVDVVSRHILDEDRKFFQYLKPGALAL